MEHIKWNCSLEVGIQEIDAQHYNLVKIINSVMDIKMKGGLRKSANKITYTLLSFAKYHFRTEETLMTKHDYPDYRKQKNDHDKLIERVAKLHGKTERGVNVDFYSVYNFLNDWFLHHTKTHDVKYVPFFVEKGVATEIKKETDKDKKQLTVGHVPLIEWESGYDFGIPDIDRQHRDLVDAINMLYSTINNPKWVDVVELAFKELAKYTSQHFNREEGLMEKFKYPYLKMHSQEHKNFKKKIAETKSRFDKFKTVVDHDFVMMLKDWFMNHTQLEDRKYLGYLKLNEM